MKWAAVEPTGRGPCDANQTCSLILVADPQVSTSRVFRGCDAAGSSVPRFDGLVSHGWRASFR